MSPSICVAAWTAVGKYTRFLTSTTTVGLLTTSRDTWNNCMDAGRGVKSKTSASTVYTSVSANFGSVRACPEPADRVVAVCCLTTAGACCVDGSGSRSETKMSPLFEVTSGIVSFACCVEVSGSLLQRKMSWPRGHEPHRVLYCIVMLAEHFNRHSIGIGSRINAAVMWGLRAAAECRYGMLDRLCFAGEDLCSLPRRSLFTSLRRNLLAWSVRTPEQFRGKNGGNGLQPGDSRFQVWQRLHACLSFRSACPASLEVGSAFAAPAQPLWKWPTHMCICPCLVP